MSEYQKLALIILAGIAITDSLIVDYLRELLWGMLQAKRNRKAVMRIHKEQAFRQRMTMSYIGPLLSQYHAEYQRWHRLYLARLITLLPQYVVAAIGIFYCSKTVVICFMAVGILLSLFFLFLRMKFNASHIAKFDKRYKRK